MHLNTVKKLKNSRTHIWKSLLTDVKKMTSIIDFKSFTDNWRGPCCKCKMCK